MAPMAMATMMMHNKAVIVIITRSMTRSYMSHMMSSLRGVGAKKKGESDEEGFQGPNSPLFIAAIKSSSAFSCSTASVVWPNPYLPFFNPPVFGL